MALRPLRELDAIEAGHDDVREKDIDLFARKQRPRLFGAVGNQHAEAVPGENLGGGLPHALVVLDEQDGGVLHDPSETPGRRACSGHDGS